MEDAPLDALVASRRKHDPGPTSSRLPRVNQNFVWTRLSQEGVEASSVGELRGSAEISARRGQRAQFLTRLAKKRNGGTLLWQEKTGSRRRAKPAQTEGQAAISRNEMLRGQADRTSQNDSRAHEQQIIIEDGAEGQVMDNFRTESTSAALCPRDVATHKVIPSPEQACGKKPSIHVASNTAPSKRKFGGDVSNFARMSGVEAPETEHGEHDDNRTQKRRKIESEEGGKFDKAMKKLFNNTSTEKKLDLRGFALAPYHIRVLTLCEALSVNTMTTRLDLQACLIGDDGVGILVKNLLLTAASKLIWVDLAMNDIHDEGAAYLLDVVKADTPLQHLDLKNNFISFNMQKDLIRAKRQAANSLEVLDLSKNTVVRGRGRGRGRGAQNRAEEAEIARMMMSDTSEEEMNSSHDDNEDHAEELGVRTRFVSGSQEQPDDNSQWRQDDDSSQEASDDDEEDTRPLLLAPRQEQSALENSDDCSETEDRNDGHNEVHEIWDSCSNPEADEDSFSDDSSRRSAENSARDHGSRGAQNSSKTHTSKHHSEHGNTRSAGTCKGKSSKSARTSSTSVLPTSARGGIPKPRTQRYLGASGEPQLASEKEQIRAVKSKKMKIQRPQEQSIISAGGMRSVDQSCDEDPSDVHKWSEEMRRADEADARADDEWCVRENGYDEYDDNGGYEDDAFYPGTQEEMACEGMEESDTDCDAPAGGKANDKNRKGSTRGDKEQRRSEKSNNSSEFGASRQGQGTRRENLSEAQQGERSAFDLMLSASASSGRAHTLFRDGGDCRRPQTGAQRHTSDFHDEEPDIYPGANNESSHNRASDPQVYGSLLPRNVLEESLLLRSYSLQRWQLPDSCTCEAECPLTQRMDGFPDNADVNFIEGCFLRAKAFLSELRKQENPSLCSPQCFLAFFSGVSHVTRNPCTPVHTLVAVLDGLVTIQTDNGYLGTHFAHTDWVLVYASFITASLHWTVHIDKRMSSAAAISLPPNVTEREKNLFKDYRFEPYSKRVLKMLMYILDKPPNHSVDVVRCILARMNESVYYVPQGIHIQMEAVLHLWSELMTLTHSQDAGTPNYWDMLLSCFQHYVMAFNPSTASKIYTLPSLVDAPPSLIPAKLTAANQSVATAGNRNANTGQNDHRCDRAQSSEYAWMVLCVSLVLCRARDCALPPAAWKAFDTCMKMSPLNSDFKPSEAYIKAKIFHSDMAAQVYDMLLLQRCCAITQCIMTSRTVQNFQEGSSAGCAAIVQLWKWSYLRSTASVVNGVRIPALPCGLDDLTRIGSWDSIFEYDVEARRRPGKKLCAGVLNIISYFIRAGVDNGNIQRSTLDKLASQLYDKFPEVPLVWFGAPCPAAENDQIKPEDKLGNLTCMLTLLLRLYVEMQQAHPADNASDVHMIDNNNDRNLVSITCWKDVWSKMCKLAGFQRNQMNWTTSQNDITHEVKRAVEARKVYIHAVAGFFRVAAEKGCAEHASQCAEVLTDALDVCLDEMDFLLKNVSTKKSATLEERICILEGLVCMIFDTLKKLSKDALLPGGGHALLDLKPLMKLFTSQWLPRRKRCIVAAMSLIDNVCTSMCKYAENHQGQNSFNALKGTASMLAKQVLPILQTFLINLYKDSSETRVETKHMYEVIQCYANVVYSVTKFAIPDQSSRAITCVHTTFSPTNGPMVKSAPARVIPALMYAELAVLCCTDPVYNGNNNNNNGNNYNNNNRNDNDNSNERAIHPELRINPFISTASAKILNAWLLCMFDCAVQDIWLHAHDNSGAAVFAHEHATKKICEARAWPGHTLMRGVYSAMKRKPNVQNNSTNGNIPKIGFRGVITQHDARLKRCDYDRKISALCEFARNIQSEPSAPAEAFEGLSKFVEARIKELKIAAISREKESESESAENLQRNRPQNAVIHPRRKDAHDAFRGSIDVLLKSYLEFCYEVMGALLPAGAGLLQTCRCRVNFTEFTTLCEIFILKPDECVMASPELRILRQKLVKPVLTAVSRLNYDDGPGCAQVCMYVCMCMHACIVSRLNYDDGPGCAQVCTYVCLCMYRFYRIVITIF
jgi:hypothetical protein